MLTIYQKNQARDAARGGVVIFRKPGRVTVRKNAQVNIGLVKLRQGFCLIALRFRDERHHALPLARFDDVLTMFGLRVKGAADIDRCLFGHKRYLPFAVFLTQRRKGEALFYLCISASSLKSITPRPNSYGT
jgi:hypothetical protein